VAFYRCSQDQERNGGPRSLPEPHPKIEQREKPKLLKEVTVPALGRDMGCRRMGQRSGV